jgi:hypothetical protein
LRAKRSPDRPFGKQLPFDSSTVAERRRLEIVNPTALNAPTLELAVWASVPTPTASRGSEAHNPFFVQCKGKGVNGQRRRESQAAGASVGHLSLSPPYGPMAGRTINSSGFFALQSDGLGEPQPKNLLGLIDAAQLKMSERLQASVTASRSLSKPR